MPMRKQANAGNRIFSVFSNFDPKAENYMPDFVSVMGRNTEQKMVFDVSLMNRSVVNVRDRTFLARRTFPY